MTDQPRAMVLASFAADALALGPHWIYDTSIIEQKFGRVERYMEPLENTYHEGKARGAFTHYGDQTLCLLESLSACPGFELTDFADRWKRLFRDYTGYFDHATKAALKNFESGNDPTRSGSPSSDLGGASRISPLVYRYRHDFDNLITSAEAQTRMTHNNPRIINSAAFFAALTASILDGNSPSGGINHLIKEGFVKAPLIDWIKEGQQSIQMETREVIHDFGQMCDIDAAFPSVIHLILKYETDLKTALVENVMAGGDSAARGLLTGMVLGAYLGKAAIPPAWLSDLTSYPHITELLTMMDKVSQAGD